MAKHTVKAGDRRHPGVFKLPPSPTFSHFFVSPVHIPFYFIHTYKILLPSTGILLKFICKAYILALSDMLESV